MLKLLFNSVKQVPFQKHLGVYMDNKSDFRKVLRSIFKLVNRTIVNCPNNLPRAPLLTTHKFFIRSQLDHRDILYDLTFNNSFHGKLELIQYNALTITDAIIGTSREKLYREIGFESLQQRR